MSDFKVLRFKSKTERKKFIVFSVLAILVMCGIFIFSAQSAEASNTTSGEFINFILSVVYDEYEVITAPEKAELISSFQGLIRTFAHGIIYFVLGFLCAGAAMQVECKNIYVKMLWTWIFTVVYALSDEVHQYFVPGRAFQGVDLLVDGVGALLGILFFYGTRMFLCYIFKRPCKDK